MFRNLRSLLSYSRVPVRIASKNDSHTLYRVRFVPEDKPHPLQYTLLRAVLILGGVHIVAGTALRVFGEEWDEPLFIPLGFAQELPSKRYGPNDPETLSYIKFNSDKKKLAASRAKVHEIIVKSLEKNNKTLFGGNVKAEGSILYYNYPVSPPPEYARAGLLLTPTPHTPTTGLLGLLTSHTYTWTTRPIPAPTMHRLTTALYPHWLFNSLYDSFSHTFSWLNKQPVESMSDLVVVGSTALKYGLADTHRSLRKTWKPSPLPRGHVLIDGIVQVSGNDVVMGIDVTASFNPETLGEWRFHRTQVRFAGRTKKKPAAAVVVREKEVADGLKRTMREAAERQRRSMEAHRTQLKEAEAEEKEVEKEEGKKSLVGLLEEKRAETMAEKGEKGEDVEDAASSGSSTKP